MSQSEKNIPVTFVAYEPYESFAAPVALLGDISIDQAKQLLDTFDNATPGPDACICSMTLQFTDRTRFGHKPNKGLRYQALELDGMFYPDRNPHCGKPNKRMTEAQKIKRCANNLRSGKCQDDFIRQTIGALLFPQYYGNTKQK